MHVKHPRIKLVFLMSAFMFFMTVTAIQAEPVRILSGACSTSSSHYVYAVSAGKTINTVNGDEFNVTTVATGGAVDNLERINRGQLQIGLGTFAVFYEAYNGMGKFKDRARKKTRALWLYSFNAQNYIVRADSGITKLKELEGKKFCPGYRGTACEVLVQSTMDSLGIKPEYYRGGLADAVAAVKDNRICGYVKAGGGLFLDASTKELRAFTKVRILDWNKDQIVQVNKYLPYLNFTTVPEGVAAEDVPEYTTPVQCIGYIGYNDSITEDQVYTIVKTLCEEKKFQEAAYPAMKGFDIPKMTMKFTKFPLHMGTIRYFREIGIKIPDNLIPPEGK